MILKIFWIKIGVRFIDGLFKSNNLGWFINVCFIVSICCLLFDKVVVFWFLCFFKWGKWLNIFFNIFWFCLWFFWRKVFIFKFFIIDKFEKMWCFFGIWVKLLLIIFLVVNLCIGFFIKEIEVWFGFIKLEIVFKIDVFFVLLVLIKVIILFWLILNEILFIVWIIL